MLLEKIIIHLFWEYDRSIFAANTRLGDKVLDAVVSGAKMLRAVFLKAPCLVFFY
jgi:hypothetical protein